MMPINAIEMDWYLCDRYTTRNKTAGNTTNTPIRSSHAFQLYPETGESNDMIYTRGPVMMSSQSGIRAMMLRSVMMIVFMGMFYNSNPLIMRMMPMAIIAKSVLLIVVGLS